MAGDKELSKPVLEQETCIAGRPQTKTQFIDYSLKELKQMLEGTDLVTIEEVGRHWGKVNELLAGGEGGGIAGLLDKAVDNVLEHWEGEAATSFAKKAREISQSLRNAAWHADLNRSQMADAGSQLREYKSQLDDIKEPSGWAKVGDALSDWSWDNGESTAKDLQDRKLTAKEVAEINEGKIGASREAQLNGVAVMENLGVQYARITRNLQQNPVKDGGDGNVGEPNRNVEYPPPVTPSEVGASRPGTSRSGNKPWSAGPTTSVKPAPTVPRDPGITGGSQLPPTTKTNVDSISPGLTGTSPGTSTGVPSGGGGNFGTSGSQGSGIVTTGGVSGLGGGTAARGGIGAAGGRGGMAGGSAAGRGAGGRSGMGGMGGGGAGAAGRGGAGAGGRGALARSRGGVIGAAKGVTGKGTGGGAGLHGSRGGSQRGAMAGGAGGAGGRGRRSEEENSQGDRPDYLVEDEETWISEEDRNRNVPRTIE
jgi:hypothetical protein